MPPMNWLSLVIAALIPMLLGFVYYHKALFGKAWMASPGMTEEDIQKGNMAIIFGVSLVCAFLIGSFIVFNVNGPGQEGVNGEFDTFKHGAGHGLIIGMMLVVLIMITNGLFERKQWKNLLINAGYWILCLIIMGGILDAMNHWPNELIG
jgi:hypothetical protein